MIDRAYNRKVQAYKRVTTPEELREIIENHAESL
jgi:hypothetical protein